MKKSILLSALCLFVITGYTQLPNFSLKNYNLKGNVKEVTTTTYYYRSTQKAYISSSEDKKKFSKEGNLLNNLSNLSMLSSNYEYNYEYKGRNLVKKTNLTYKKETSEVKSETYTVYNYKNNKLTSVNYQGVSPTTIEYEYNNDNQLIKEVKKGTGGELVYEKTYQYSAKNDYSLTTYYYAKGVKGKQADIYQYKNDKLVSMNFNSYGTPSNSSYTYNKQGDRVTYTYQGKLKTETFYEYDKNNNWIKKTDKTFDTYTKSYRYTFVFRKIRYKKETTGDSKFDVDHVKKYEAHDSYELKPYESYSSKYSAILKNPTSIEEMHVLKTQGTKFKVKTKAGNYITNHVVAIKHTNGLDMIVYHPKSQTTALVKDFNDELLKREIWHTAKIISKTDSIFWTVNEKGNWFIIDRGRAYDKYDVTKLKYSTENPDDVIVYVNGVATYVMKNYRSAEKHKLYALRKL